MADHRALDPDRSVVVEACAGSGKTWLLVSRMVRLLLDGVPPGQILAITFTRKAAQEMQARLQDWLRDLAQGDDDFVRRFLAERGLSDPDDTIIHRARLLYENTMLAQPGITLSTFHGWFMQILQRAPLNSDVAHGMSLPEQISSTLEEAWEAMLEELRQHPDSELAQHLQWLFQEYGLTSTRALLGNFLNRRSEWWAYVQSQSQAPVEFALQELQNRLQVNMDILPDADWGSHADNETVLFDFIRCLASNGTDKQKLKAGEIEKSWTDSAPEDRFNQVSALLLNKEKKFDGRIKPTSKQDADAFITARDRLQSNLQQVLDAINDQHTFRLNTAVIHCGAALLQHYQQLKLIKRQIDFTDLEWQLCHLMQHSEHAETMQYKLDSRYRHILLDEFQDTNPLQWQIMRAWFDAAVAVESDLRIFLVGDPKQSIYRFRRADARLFSVSRDYLVTHFNAIQIQNNQTRRSAQAIMNAVNSVFDSQPDGFEFIAHETFQKSLPGFVEVLALAQGDAPDQHDSATAELILRDPLTTPLTEKEEHVRYVEAEQFAEHLHSITSCWQIRDANGNDRPANWGDVMVLVRARTHLNIYESALRAHHIPFISSRRGGLLETLEAEDIQALLTFLITPFADLSLAHALRSPILSCQDEDLLQLAKTAKLQSCSWWHALQQMESPSAALQRAQTLLNGWLALSDRLPVHDLLDRIYFEGDVVARYAAAHPPELRARTVANLHALMEIALSVDAGRYPSLPRFLKELRELRDSKDDAPDEGRLGNVGNAVRIYTVHESKGLEAPIVWLLDANSAKNARGGNDVLLDWPPHAYAPTHFSLYTSQAMRSRKLTELFEQDAAQQAREEMNLLYVAMTRARQALIVSGCSTHERENKTPTWYDRISATVAQTENPLVHIAATAETAPSSSSDAARPALPPDRIELGKRHTESSQQQQRGIWLHAVLQLCTELPTTDADTVKRRLSIPQNEFESLWLQAQQLLHSPQLQPYFDPAHYLRAENELAYVDAKGELRRIDRLVEFDSELWVLDYKSGARADAAQILQYRAAMQAIYPEKKVRCALIFADGRLEELA